MKTKRGLKRTSLIKGLNFREVLAIMLLISLWSINSVDALPQIEFVDPTPDNGTSIDNSSVEINVSITEASLNEIKFNWNKTNYTMYNDSLVLMMNFDNVSALGENDTHVFDVSNNGNNGTVINATFNATGGKFNGVFELDGDGDYINLDNAVSLGANTGTFSAWVYNNEDDNILANNFIIGQQDTNNRFYIKYDASADKVELGLGNNANINTNGAVKYQTWHYVTMTYDNGDWTYYSDGVNVSNGTYAGTITDADGFQIGAYEGGGNYWNGSIDEVRIWNRSLSAAEVNQQYLSNLNKYDADKWHLYINQSKNATTGLDNGVYTYQAFASNTSNEWNQTVQRTATISVTAVPQIEFVDPTPSNNTITSNKSIEINVSITEDILNEIKFNWDGTNYTMYNDSLVLMMNFDNISSLGENDTHVFDVSNNGNNGTVVGATFNSTGGKFGGGFEFNGSNEYINVPYSQDFNFTGNFTVSLWARPIETDDMYIISRYDTSSKRVWALKYEDNTFRFRTSSNGVASNEIISPLTYSANQWYYVTGVITDTQRILYINGEKVIYDGNVTIDTGSNTPVSIGRYVSGWYFNGSIDEVRIWNRSLSADEINQQYFSNLNKYDTDKWTLYVNQTKKIAGFFNGVHTYQAFASNVSDGWNQTEQRTITIDSISVNTDKTSDSWLGEIVIYGNLSSFGNFTGWSVNATITPPTTASETIVLYDNGTSPDATANDGLYSGRYDISYTGAVRNDIGTYNISVNATNGTSSTNDTASFRTFTVRRWFGNTDPDSYADFNVTWNRTSWHHNVTNVRIVDTASNDHVIVKFPIIPSNINISNLNVLEETANTLNSYELRDNIVILNINTTNGFLEFGFEFDAVSDLATTYIDRYNTDHIGNRLGYNGYVIWNQYTVKSMIPDGHTSKGAIIDLLDTENGTTHGVDCFERVAVQVDDACHAGGAGYIYNLYWDGNWTDWLYSANTSEIIFKTQTPESNTSQWYSANTTKVNRTVTFYSQERYQRYDFVIKNKDTAAHNLPLVWGREQWIYPNESDYDRGIIPNNNTDFGTEHRFSADELGSNWFAAYDTNSSYATSLFFLSNLTDDMPTYAYFIYDLPLSPTTCEYPIDYSDSSTAHMRSIFFEKDFGSVPAGETRNFTFFHWAGHSDNRSNLVSLIESEADEVFEDTTSPTISFSCSPTSVNTGTTITCSCSATDNLDSNPNVSYTENPSTSSAGTFTTTCTATDNAGNSDSSSISYTVSDSGSAGTPSFYTNTIVQDNKEFSELKILTKELSKKQRIKIKINNEEHYIGVINLTNTTATINISSKPQQAIFNIGDEKKFEVNEDNYYDIYVKLNSIENNKANLTIKSIHEEIPAKEREKQDEEIEKKFEKDSGPVKEKHKLSELITALIIVFIIILIIKYQKKIRSFFH